MPTKRCMNVHAHPKHKRITATEANRRFSQLLRDVAAGTTYTVTSHGRPVAVIEPVPEQVVGHVTDSLMEFVAGLPRRHAGDWKRSDLYE